MLAPIDFNTGRLFEIYSIGDGLFMKRCLDAVASLSNAGVLLSLGGLGMMIGLLVTGGTAITTGGQKNDLSYLLIGFLLFGVMFGMKANVVVHDLGGAPGVMAGGAYTVDNVPYGVAAAGAIISGVGLAITENMQQAFSLATPTPSGVGSYGRGLEWIDAVRSWSLPELNDANGIVGAYKANLASYLAYCTMIEAMNGHLDIRSLMNSGTPFANVSNGPNAGMISSNKFLMTKWKAPGAEPTDLSCAEAGALLKNQGTGAALYGAFADSVSARSSAHVNQPSFLVTSPQQQLTDAFASIGIAGMEAQKIVASMSINSLWTKSLTKGTLSSQDINTQLMLDQAAMQRAYQWGGQESQFRRIMRPMTAFFESMIYACSPFMAFVVGLGAWGVKMLVKYLVLTVWVTLWLPVMAVVNMFQLTMVQHAVAAMKEASAVAPMPITSMAGSAFFQMQVMDWISTGSMLASSVPAITLMLLFGGAMTATHLAGRMQLGDFVNEKLASPAVADPSSAMKVAPQGTFDGAVGYQATGTGSMVPMFSSNTANSRAVSSASSELASASTNYSHTAGQQLAQNFSTMESAGIAANVSTSAAASSANSFTAGIAKSFSLSQTDTNSSKYAAVAAIASSAGVDAGVAALGSLGLSGKMTESEEKAFVQSLQSAANKAVSTDQSAKVGMNHILNDVLTHQSGYMASKGIAGGSSETANKAYSDMATASETYQDAISGQQGLASGQSMNLRQLAHHAVGTGAADNVAAAAIQYGGAEAYQVALGDVRNAAWASGATADEQAYMAGMQVLAGHTSAAMNADYATERASALIDGLQAGGMAISSGMTGIISGAGSNVGVGAEATANAGLGHSGVAGFGSTQSAVGHKAETGEMPSSMVNQAADAAGSQQLNDSNIAMNAALGGLAASAGQASESVLGQELLSDARVNAGQLAEDKRQATVAQARSNLQDSSFGTTLMHGLGAAGAALDVLSSGSFSANVIGAMGAETGSYGRLEYSANGIHALYPQEVSSMNSQYEAAVSSYIDQGYSPDYSMARASVEAYQDHGSLTPFIANNFDHIWNEGSLTKAEMGAIKAHIDGGPNQNIDALVRGAPRIPF